MRKASAFVMVLLVICSSFSVLWAGENEVAVDGVLNGVASAFASYLSEPRIALQGVTAMRGEGALPLRISFVRSDVSTYADSLSFFGNGISTGGFSKLSLYSPVFPTERIRQRLRESGLKKGDLILDGTVYLLEGNNESMGNAALSGDYNLQNARFGISVVATGELVGRGAIIEGVLSISGDSGRFISFEAERLRVNGEMASSGPVVLLLEG